MFQFFYSSRGLLLLHLIALPIVQSAPVVEQIVDGLNKSLTQKPLFPGLQGFCGWNYECATAIHALLLDEYMNLDAFTPDSSVKNNTIDFLYDATQFPQPGSHIRSTEWLFTPGDRIGLFGGLYHHLDVQAAPKLGQSTVVKSINAEVIKQLLSWPKKKGVFVRKFGWIGPFQRLFWITIRSSWIWIDDSFIGGYSLVTTNPDELCNILLSYNDVLRDSSDGLWWHGAHVNWDQSVTVNGQKWGRGNAWMLLSLSTFLINTKDEIIPRKGEIETLLLDQLKNLMKYQRPSGAFGNVIDSDISPDESSLTSVYIFSTGAAVHLNLLSISDAEVGSAEKAWYWLMQRTVVGLTLSDTCAGQHLATDRNQYDQNVGQSDGPGVAFVLYAGLGRKMLDLA